MDVISVFKTSKDESAVTVLVPDAILTKFNATIAAMGVQYASQGVDNDDEPFTTSDAGLDYSPTVELIRKQAKLGDRLTDGRIRRAKEVLGSVRAENLFGPHWGVAAWALFTPADPLRFRSKPDGSGWYQEVNPNHNSQLLAALLEVEGEDPTTLDQQRQAKHEDRETVVPTNLTPEGYYESIIRGSTTGRNMSMKQAIMVDKIIPYASKRMFTGGKDGSVQDFLRYYSKNTRNQDGEWGPNPNFVPAAYEYAVRLSKQG